ncbi:MAG: nucleotidyltransferase family protein [Phormidesmis sp.]
MKTLSEIQQWLVLNKPALKERYSVKELGIFGSYVRQEQTEASDVDVLVEFSEVPGLLKFIDLENYLSDHLGVKVDLVHKKGLKPRIGKQILAEVIYL